MAKKSTSIEEFTSRAKSILLREDRGKQLHAQWRDKIDHKLDAGRDKGNDQVIFFMSRTDPGCVKSENIDLAYG